MQPTPPPQPGQPQPPYQARPQYQPQPQHQTLPQYQSRPQHHPSPPYQPQSPYQPQFPHQPQYQPPQYQQPQQYQSLGYPPQGYQPQHQPAQSQQPVTGDAPPPYLRTTPESQQALLSKANRDIGFGAVWLAAGLGITLFSFFYFEGAAAIVAWGPALYGIIKIIMGVVRRVRYS